MPHSQAEPEAREGGDSPLKRQGCMEMAASSPQAAQAPPAQTKGGSGGSARASADSKQQRQGSIQQRAQLAVLLLERGRHRDALAALQPLLAQQPDSADLLCLQGRCHAAAGSRAQVGGLDLGVGAGGAVSCVYLLCILLQPAPTWYIASDETAPAAVRCRRWLPMLRRWQPMQHVCQLCWAAQQCTRTAGYSPRRWLHWRRHCLPCTAQPWQQ